MSDSLVTVEFKLEGPDSEWHGLGVETLWAVQLEPDLFRLDNIPLYIYEVSFNDVVKAEPGEVDGMFVFVEVVSRGGHSTYRIFVEEETDESRFNEHWQPLEALGCTFERGDEKFLAVDVPKSADIYAAYELLEHGEDEGVWAFEEGHCGHKLKDQ